MRKNLWDRYDVMRKGGFICSHNGYVLWATASKILQMCNVLIFLTFLTAMCISKNECLRDIWCAKMDLSLQRVRKTVQRHLKCPSVVFGHIFFSSLKGSVVTLKDSKGLKCWVSQSSDVETMKEFFLDTETFTLAMTELVFHWDWPHPMEIGISRKSPAVKKWF